VCDDRVRYSLQEREDIFCSYSLLYRIFMDKTTPVNLNRMLCAWLIQEDQSQRRESHRIQRRLFFTCVHAATASA
jgi:hypothetical protein